MKSLKLSLGLTAFLVTLLGTSARAGIQVDVERDPRLPVSYINLVIQGGSTSDPANRLGLTSFLGEMLTRGTRRHTKEQIDIILDQWGGQLGLETRAEYTVVRGAVLSSKLPEFLALVEEILIEPSFPEAEIRKLKSETISALMAEQANDHSLSAKFFTRFLFQGHAYGRPVLGTRKDIEAIQRTDLASQHLKLMNPQRVMFLASGDVNEKDYQSWATRLAGRLPGREPLAALAAPVRPTKRRLQIVNKPDRTQTQIEIGQIGTLMSAPDYAALYLGNSAFGGGSFLSRLMQEIRVKRGWSYGASSAFRFGVQPRSWQVHLFPAEKDTAAALAHTLRMIEALRERGITEAEFNLARQAAINSAAFMSDTPKKRTENRILEKTLGLENGFFEEFSGLLEKVTLAETNQALRKFLDPATLSISILGTVDRIKPAVLEAAGLAPADGTVVPYTQD